jgi:ABC-type polysaccharide/polyol phosphate transport system ATPase subunit
MTDVTQNASSRGENTGGDFAISIAEVGKRYKRRSNRPFFLRELVWRMIGKTTPDQEFWACRNVSFNVRKGEAVAIIGHNGAGKSTLLGMVAGTIHPTSGSVRTRGRVCALLELGAGFHPDLTGKENVFLNASLLGLSEAEAEERFEWIVDFAELRDFIDQPIRTYSSGMWVRLGFAVAVLADPEILIVDEVLAVGDADFQRKCMNRIMEMKQKGTTFLLVSHSADIIRFLCERAVWIEHGVVKQDGPAGYVLDCYARGVPG